MPRKCLFPWLLFAGVVFGAVFAGAASVKPMPFEERAALAEAVLHASVETVVSFRDDTGRIHTVAELLVRESFKGRAPQRLAFRYRGGTVGNTAETVTGSPELRPGDECLFLFTRGGEDRLVTVGGPAGAPRIGSRDGSGLLERIRTRFPEPADGLDLRPWAAEAAGPPPESRAAPQAAPLESDPEGLFLPPRRSVIPDRGEPIRYLVDMDTLPPGISETEALAAVENALAAWAGASSVEFRFDGIESFGRAATDVPAEDGRLRIQLHDTYNVVGESVLGIGGHSYTWIHEFQEGGSGATIDGVGFHRVTRSHVVMNHTAASLQNHATFEAALCHEVGHALGLAHSSEDPDEADPYLRDAIMYYAIQGGDRGATLAQWDRDVIETVHPAETPPPYGFDRVLRAVTSHSAPENPEVNQVRVPGYSLHASAPEAGLHFPTSNNGSFSLSGSVLTYEPDGAISDSKEIDPEEGLFFDRAFVRFDDGLHQSPPVQVRVIRYYFDSHANGLPDSWAEAHFGSASPVAGFSGPHDDPDGDGLTNLQEFLLGTDPLDANSGFPVREFDGDSLLFDSRPHDVYELHRSVDLDTWEFTGRVLRAGSETGMFSVPGRGEARAFYRVQRVP